MNPAARAYAGLLAGPTGLPAAEIETLVATPPDRKLGDLAFPCFVLAKRLRKAPPAIAAELAASVQPSGLIAGVQAAGPYLNARVDTAALAAALLPAFHEQGPLATVQDLVQANRGARDGAGRTLVVDYSSPNIAKPFHVGHLRSTVIGGALVRMYGALGWKTVGVNHLGDWGTQFGKLIEAFRRWGDEAQLDGPAPVRHLYEVYVRFHKEAEQDPALEDQGRAWFLKLEQGDAEARSYWERFREVSLREFRQVYAALGVDFDAWSGESFYNDKMQDTVARLKERGLLVESEGARVVDLSDLDMPPLIAVKSDGATTYHTRDLAAAEYRAAQYRFDRMLYVVGQEQRLHFRQLFAVLGRMGHDWAGSCVHVDFGRILGLSTRKGSAIFLEDLLEEAERRAREVVSQKNAPAVASAPAGLAASDDHVARAVGVGAVIFSDLSKGRVKDQEFDWERLMAFDGETGPYLQYSHARLASILRKCGGEPEGPPAADALAVLTGDDEKLVLMCLGDYGRALARAVEADEPSILATQLIACAQAWNRVEREVRVKDAPEPLLRTGRLHLVAALRRTLEHGLRLLGVEPLEEM